MGSLDEATRFDKIAPNSTYILWKYPYVFSGKMGKTVIHNIYCLPSVYKLPMIVFFSEEKEQITSKNAGR
jgi:hypothetical protein